MRPWRPARPPLTAPRRPPQVICTKVRDGAKRIVRLKEGEPAGRHVVIVDDLVQSGGTLIECHALLSSLGATHGERRGPYRAACHMHLHACALCL